MSQWSVGTRLKVCFAAQLTFTAVLAFADLMAMNTLRRNQDEIAVRQMRRLELTGVLEREQAALNSELRGLILSTLDKNAAEVALAERQFAAALASARQAAAESESLAADGAERREIAELKAALQQWSGLFQEAGAYCLAKKPWEAERLRDERAPVLIEGGQRVAALLKKSVVASAAALDREGDAISNRSRIAAAALGGLALLVGAGVLWIVRWISATLGNHAVELSASAQQLNAAAGQLAEASQAQAQGASGFAASLEETSASANEVDAHARGNSERADATLELAGRAQARFSAAGESLGLVVGAMDEIHTQSGEVARILKVIDEIAFQTNLL
ncbi:MAG TPA: hypothetical protein DEH78_29520, partial [Solibacterales bacterium]|nr:hypothetical protein [Bryobacterales bacterium]